MGTEIQVIHQRIWIQDKRMLPKNQHLDFTFHIIRCYKSGWQDIETRGHNDKGNPVFSIKESTILKVTFYF